MNYKILITTFLFGSLSFMQSCSNGNNNTTKNDTANTTSTSSMSDSNNNMKMDSGMKMNSNQSNNGLMDAMNNMMANMNAMKMTGDFDKDFATMMIEHHQGAIDMAKIELAQGSDEKMKSMAQNIITKQTDEQNKLRDLLNNMKPSGMKMGEGELQKSMSEMSSKTKSMQMSGNVDKDFATMMSSHHQDGIAMAKLELKNGMDSKLKQMAQKGIDDQQKEINEFKTWQANHK
ncbi:MAG: DUF305 domain-containing protein [Chitinophagaceae bacterium]